MFNVPLLVDLTSYSTICCCKIIYFQIYPQSWRLNKFTILLILIAASLQKDTISNKIVTSDKYLEYSSDAALDPKIARGTSANSPPRLSHPPRSQRYSRWQDCPHQMTMFLYQIPVRPSPTDNRYPYFYDSSGRGFTYSTFMVREIYMITLSLKQWKGSIFQKLEILKFCKKDIIL